MFDVTTILHWIKKHFRKKDILILTLLGLLFLATRIIRLDQFPIFSDEGIYVHWARIAWKDASWRFVSLTDGRQPLQTWGTIPFIKLFPDNVLLAGRLFSVACGSVSLIGLFSLLFYLFGKKSAYIGAIIYIVNPYFLFYDRIALVDSAVNAACIWILFFSILLARYRRLSLALLFGLVSGIFLLAKSSVRLFVGMSALAPILFIEYKNKKNFLNCINYFILIIIGFSIAFGIYNVQRLSPFFNFVSQKNLTFIMSFQEFISNPFLVFSSNARLIPLYVFWEMGFFIIPFSFIGIYLLAKKNIRLYSYLILWVLIPYLSIAFFSKVLFPRYVLFLGSLFTIFAVFFLSTIKQKTIFTGICVFLFITMAYFDHAILFNYTRLNMPEIDRGQYITGRTAGWGMREIVEFAREKSKKKRVVILAEGDFGLAKDVLEAFVKDNDNIYLKSYWPMEKKQLEENKKELGKNLVYAVFATTEKFPSDWPIQLVKKYDKPYGTSSLYLFQLLP